VISTGGIAALAAKLVRSKKSVRNDNTKKVTQRRNDDGYIEHGTSNDDE
jgi:hypothetical protein